MADPLYQKLTDDLNMANAMAKQASSQQERTNWYYYALAVKAQRDKLGTPYATLAQIASLDARLKKLESAVPTPIVPIPAQGPSTWPPSGSITIAPGDNWVTKIAANPVGTVFAVLPGTHSQVSCTPKNNQQFIGPPGTAGTYGPTGLTAVLNGGNVQTRAIDVGSTTGVTLQNLAITNYKYLGQNAAVSISGPTPSGWLVDSCEIYSNGYCGLEISSGSTATHCRIHHNAYQGYKSFNSTGATMSYCEIDHNHTAVDDPFVEASGGKAVMTTSWTMDHCWSHHNTGPGLWTDINNDLTVYTNCLVESNTYAGIMHEISYGVTIHDCQFNANGDGLGGWIWNAGVLISASGPVALPVSEIYNNDFNGNYNAVSLVHQNRAGDFAAFTNKRQGTEYKTRNIYVHNNTVRNTIHETGAADDSDGSVWSSNNLWDFNTYTGNPAAFFSWGPPGYEFQTFATWKGFGQDLHSTFT